ncbi:unnamed protein product [Allacma fusca]|uniref:Uncharacterized protein n=1 Tax=Allacma fusca TaxID=39272 RepID=A0A8J2LH01_9HEXA|nr:unnamed protein product [Allacma fusca]
MNTYTFGSGPGARHFSGNQQGIKKPMSRIPDKSGPFMSLILHRLDLNNLPRVTSELAQSVEESDDEDIQGVTDREDEGDEEFLTVTDCEEEMEEDVELMEVAEREDEIDYDKDVELVEDTVQEQEIDVEYEVESEDEKEEEVQASYQLPTESQERSVVELIESDHDQGIGVRRSWRNKNKKINYDYKSLLGSDSESEELTVSERRLNKDNHGEELGTDLDQSGLQQKMQFSNEEETESIVKKRLYCGVCKTKGELLYCSCCPRAFHLSCLDTPLAIMPDNSWKCFACNLEPLDKVDRVFTWRNQGLSREFFAHFAGKSYWKCRWVPEIQLQVFQPYLVRCYYKKYGKHVPPNLDEGDARRLRKNHQDPLESRFYQFGIRADWLRINRIIDQRKENNGKLSYLVKWQQLGYDSATWEDEDSCVEIAAEFSVATRIYHEWLNYFWGNPCLPTAEQPFVHKYIIIPPEQPASNLKIKLSNQPEYLPTGMLLHEYQLEGVNWLRYSWAKEINTILGDEMGLGKTIQTIVFLSSLVKEGHSQGPFLISAPLSTLLNWEREFEAWAPELYLVTYIGDQNTRQLIRKTEFVEDSSHINKQNQRVRSPVKFHVLLTSYQFPTIDATCLGSIPWEMIVVDEGHRLKDDRTLLFKDLMKYTTSYKLLLTGTPLQNNLEELFNLLNFLCPEKFSDVSAFLTEFEDIAKEDQIKRLHSLLGPHLLRRMKVDVLKDMPSKSELIVRVELSPLQKQYSKHILMKNFQALNAKGGRQTSLLNVFMDWRKICNHPYLFSKACAEAPKDPVTGWYELEAMTEASGKLVMLRKMLEILKKQGHRVLIFSQMTSMLDILEEFLAALGHSYERIDGSILGARRQDSIDRFNAEGAEQFVFLLSTKAGGLGINLATADTVIIFDSDWNPHNDIQAFSRAHRIGQKNKVMIYRFVTRRSVEEKIVQVCKKKMMLTHLVVRPEVGKTIFSKDELQDIIRFGTEELFKDQDANAPIFYTDAMIETILDRTQVDVSEKNDWTNDYFQGFKVATCEVQDDVVHPSQGEAKDPDQWKYLLRQEIKRKEDEANDLTNYGKGMRKRFSLKYEKNEKLKKPTQKSENDIIIIKEKQPRNPRTYGPSRRKDRQYVGESMGRLPSVNYLTLSNSVHKVLNDVDATTKRGSNVINISKSMQRAKATSKQCHLLQKTPYFSENMVSYPNGSCGNIINTAKEIIQETLKVGRKRLPNSRPNVDVPRRATSIGTFDSEVTIHQTVNINNGTSKRRPGRPRKSLADSKCDIKNLSKLNREDKSLKVQKLRTVNEKRNMQRQDGINISMIANTLPRRSSYDEFVKKGRGRLRKQPTQRFSFVFDNFEDSDSDVIEVESVMNVNEKRRSNVTETATKERQVTVNHVAENAKIKTQQSRNGDADPVRIGRQESSSSIPASVEVKAEEIRNKITETTKIEAQQNGIKSAEVFKQEMPKVENTRPEIIKIVSQPTAGTATKFLLSSAKIAPQLTHNNFAS